VAGRTGAVTLTTSDISLFTSKANVASVGGQTGVVSIVAGNNVTVSMSTGSILISASGGGGGIALSYLFG
jgi:hypothetical protein